MTNGKYALHFELAAGVGELYFSAEVSYVNMGPESDDYRSEMLGLYGDPLIVAAQPSPVAVHTGRPFSTYDRDNDGGGKPSNAGGGWWYNSAVNADGFVFNAMAAAKTCVAPSGPGVLILGSLPTTPSCFTWVRLMIRNTE